MAPALLFSNFFSRAPQTTAAAPVAAEMAVDQATLIDRVRGALWGESRKPPCVALALPPYRS